MLHKGLNELDEIRVFLLNDGLISLILVTDVLKELLEMLAVIHDQLINDSFVKINAWELIRITLNNDCSHLSEVLTHCESTCLHYENVFTLNLSEELHVGLNVLLQRLEPDGNVKRLLN